MNAVGIACGLAVVACVAEVWAWAKADFHYGYSDAQKYRHPRAGLLLVPGSEVRNTNMLDYWTVSRANRWGFLAPPPPPPPRRERNDSMSCRVAVVGDSFVHAAAVPMSDKLNARFEEMARRRVPDLGVGASAYGWGGTGQIHQLGYYDEFVIRTSPKIVVLVFVHNDFDDNYPNVNVRFKKRFVIATKADDGSFELRPPCPTKGRGCASVGPLTPLSAWHRIKRGIVRRSYALAMLNEKKEALAVLRDLRSFAPPSREALEYTAFALDQWMVRARRDDFALVALASHTMGTRGDVLFDLLNALASARGIPVVDQQAHIARQGYRVSDAHWAHDFHWNAAGHQWAAEALMEWLEQNPEACA